MIHDDIYKEFLVNFPFYKNKIEHWFPAGKDTIRIRLLDNSEYIFTYHSPLNLRLETVESFIPTLLGR